MNQEQPQADFFNLVWEEVKEKLTELYSTPYTMLVPPSLPRKDRPVCLEEWTAPH